MNRLPYAVHVFKSKSALLVGICLLLSLPSWPQMPLANSKVNDAILSRPADRVTGKMDGSQFQLDKAPIGLVAPLQILHQLPVVSLCINGHGPYDLLLDTGTESTLVDKKLASELELAILDRTELMSPNGMHPVGRAVAPEVVLGSRKLVNIEFLVDDLRELRSLSPSLRGILGKNILTQFNFLLDYRHHQVELQPVAEEQAGFQVPFDLEDGRIILSVELPGAQKLRLQLDSGTTHTLLFQSPSQVGQRADNALLSTSDGTTGVRETRIQELRLGSAILHDVQAGLISPAAIRGIDGLLPTNLFDTVYFDFAGRFIAVTGSKIVLETASTRK